MIPEEHTIAVVEHEISAVLAWAKRKTIQLKWDSNAVALSVILVQPETGENFYLYGDLKGYKVIPPAWTFRNELWEGGSNKSDYPKPAKTKWGSSIFHKQPTICVPFNRLAYKEHEGPHSDWGGPSKWLSAGGSYIKAHTLGDMLQAIRRDFLFTRGRMG